MQLPAFLCVKKGEINMLVHSMYVYYDKKLIDIIQYDDIFEFLENSGWCMSMRKLYEYEKAKNEEVEDQERLNYDFKLNLLQAYNYNTQINITKKVAVSIIPHCLLPRTRKLVKSRENGYGGNNIYSISKFYINDIDYVNNALVEADRCDCINLIDALKCNF